jgi:hypothetical protein
MLLTIRADTEGCRALGGGAARELNDAGGESPVHRAGLRDYQCRSTAALATSASTGWSSWSATRERILPQVGGLLAAIKSGKATMMEMEEAAF